MKNYAEDKASDAYNATKNTFDKVKSVGYGIGKFSISTKEGFNAIREGNNFTINGRTYGMHDGTLYPISGEGLITLDRGGYKALGVYKKFGETPQAETILNNMGVSAETRSQALKIYKAAEGIN